MRLLGFLARRLGAGALTVLLVAMVQGAALAWLAWNVRERGTR